jgi:hypothetical protein
MSLRRPPQEDVAVMGKSPEMAGGTEAETSAAHQAASLWEGAGRGMSDGHSAPVGQ